MNEDRQTLISRLDALEKRLKGVENRRRGDEHGLVAKFARLGVIVGCLGGILGGSNLLIQWRKNLQAAPDIELQTAPALVFDWLPEQHRLDVKCAVSLRNNGDAGGAIEKPSVTIRPCGGSAPGLPVSDIKLAENNFNTSFPLKLSPDGNRKVDLIVESADLPSFDGVFGVQRPYELVIDLNRNPSAIRPTKTRYSFALGTDAVTTLTTTGEYSHLGADARCGQ